MIKNIKKWNLSVSRIYILKQDNGADKNDLGGGHLELTLVEVTLKSVVKERSNDETKLQLPVTL